MNSDEWCAEEERQARYEDALAEHGGEGGLLAVLADAGMTFVLLVALLVGLVLSDEASASDTVQWSTTTTSFDCGNGTPCFGQGPSAMAAAQAAVDAHNTFYAQPGAMVLTSVSAPVYATGGYTATGYWVQGSYSGLMLVTGTCAGGCTGDTGSSPGTIPLDATQVGFWVVTTGAVIAFGLGFIGGRMR